MFQAFEMEKYEYGLDRKYCELVDYKLQEPDDIPGLQFGFALLEMKDHVNLEIFTPACLPRK